jgi:hypothetical protein
MMTPTEYRDWLVQQIDTITGWQNFDLDLHVNAEAADMVREAGEIALLLGRPDLYKRGTCVRSPLLALPVAKEMLGECLRAANELLKETEAVSTVSTAVAVMGPTARAEPNTADPQAATKALTGLAELLPSYQGAYQQYQRAVSYWGAMTDKEAYNRLNKEDNETDELPPFSTWARYLRGARRHYGTQKNTPRAGRTGRSIVTPDEIEYRPKKEEDDD